MTWSLKRTVQCTKCPWRVSTDPYDIPDGYDLEKHKALEGTIAKDATFKLGGELRSMACHESNPEEEIHCVGWLMNQLGTGNNIGLRISMLDCDNAKDIRTIGEQHERFEDTIPEERVL